jgi:hypothetical protein
VLEGTSAHCPFAVPEIHIDESNLIFVLKLKVNIAGLKVIGIVVIVCGFLFGVSPSSQSWYL